MTATGDVERLLRRHGRNFVAGIRLLTLAPTAVIAVAVGRNGPSPPATYGVMAALAAWSVLYAAMLRRRSHTWITIVDAAVLAGVGLLTPWIVPMTWVTTGKSWMVPFVAFACAGYQYYATALVGAVSAVLATSGVVVGTLLTGPLSSMSPTVRTAAWGLVVALLGRILWICLSRGGALAEAALAEAEKARREQALATAVRADELELNRMLHDTAAATLLMVGVGQVAAGRALIAAQARHDLDALTGSGPPPAQTVITAAAIRGWARSSGLVTDLRVEPSLPALPGDVAAAMASATREALRNVARHSGVTTCQISASRRDGRTVIGIHDHGVGFDPSHTRSGHGLSGSIIGRMRTVGGDAEIRSAPRSGTSVALRWPQ